MIFSERATAQVGHGDERACQCGLRLFEVLARLVDGNQVLVEHALGDGGGVARCECIVCWAICRHDDALDHSARVHSSRASSRRASLTAYRPSRRPVRSAHTDARTRTHARVSMAALWRPRGAHSTTLERRAPSRRRPSTGPWCCAPR